jgi:UDP-glucose 4-epimerase
LGKGDRLALIGYDPTVKSNGKILVVGGAGYIGSTATLWLLERGYEVHVLDDLSTGFRELIQPGVPVTIARAGAPEARELLARERFDAVMHFAARALAGESVEKPDEYHENNVEQTRTLLDAMVAAGTLNFVFSSTCAVFGNPVSERLSEASPKNPVNPYGATKLEVEAMLAEQARKTGMRSVALRYFNAAGAEPGLRVGELHEPETHLIPRALIEIARGGEVAIFGTDYDTPDGTCVRDYIHVWDLAAAHELALARLFRDRTPRFEAFNLGSEKGFSVREAIEACSRVTGKKARTREAARRPGDPPQLIADSSLAKRELGFALRHSSLDQIVATAWAWHQKRRR